MMKPILFACDLDNTLIHSVKHRREGDLCVEWIDGKEQGFMAPDVPQLLREAAALVELVPVTTRSVAQYQRIVWPEGCRPRRAVTTHGATLLLGDDADPAWAGEVSVLTAPVLDALRGIVRDLADTGLFLRCRMVDEAYAFVYLGRENAAMETAMTWPLPGGVCRIRSGKKVYFIPMGIDKAAAVNRLRQERDYACVVCAGDSGMDVPMLNAADAAFAPVSLAPALAPRPGLCLCPDDDFPREMLRRVIDLARSL